MGCYFGCGTGGSRCSWCFWTLFLLAGAGCLIGFGLTAVGCGAEVVQCGEDSGLILPAEGTNYIWDYNNPDWAYQTCLTIYGDNSTAVSLCEPCALLVEECAPTPFYLFIAGIVLLALCWIPCFYFCCCANAPEPKQPVYTQAPPGTYATSAPAGQQAQPEYPKV